MLFQNPLTCAVDILSSVTTNFGNILQAFCFGANGLFNRERAYRRAGKASIRGGQKRLKKRESMDLSKERAQAGYVFVLIFSIGTTRV